jgi:uncharacterized RDD family membrane protein YckC
MSDGEPGDEPSPTSPLPSPAATASSGEPDPRYAAPPDWVGRCQACGAPLGPGVGCPNCGQLVGAPPGYRIATPLKRLGEYLLEWLLVIVTLVIGWVVWSLIIWSNGQTPAKQVLGMRVYRLTERRPAGWGRMALREVVVRWLLIGLLSALTAGIGFIVAALLVFSTNRQTLWDMIAQTVVVDEP